MEDNEEDFEFDYESEEEGEGSVDLENKYYQAKGTERISVSLI